MSKFDNPNHSFSPTVAAKYGIIEAILIHHFQHWINYNKRLGRNKKDGRIWTYQTRKEIAAWFDYLSEDQVRRATDNLVVQGVLIKGNYNKSKFDKSIWYAFKNEEMFTIGKFANSIEESANSIEESANSSLYTDTKTDMFVADDPVGSPPYKISVKENNNSEITITRDDLFKYASAHPEWKVEEINYAWEVLASYQAIVYDWQRFIEGTVQKYRNQLKSKRASGEKVSKGPTQKSQNRGKGQCNQTIPTELKNINSNSSENASGEQVSQERISITEALRRLEDGLRSPKTSLS